ADAAKILERLLAMREGAGLLAYPAAARALAAMYWAADPDDPGARARWHRAAQSLARLASSLGDRGARTELSREVEHALGSFVERDAMPFAAADVPLAA